MEPVGRWQPGAHERLATAALELYAERGFEQTTALDIAERAGVTERTFFRYFADKREVLFQGSSALQAAVVESVASAEPGLGAIDVAACALESSAVVIDDRDYARRRLEVIVANPSLLERELLKFATLGAAVAEALEARGVPKTTATLAAEAALTVFRVGFERWATDVTAPPLAECIREALADLRDLTARA